MTSEGLANIGATSSGLVTAAAIEATFTADQQIYSGTGVSTGELIDLLSALKEYFATKGQLLAGTGAGTGALLTVGSDNQVLTADSSQATGLKWAAAAAGGGGLLGSLEYKATQTLTITATNLTLVDATNHRVTFTAPASGKVFVMIRANITCTVGTGEAAYVILCSTDGTIKYGSTAYLTVTNLAGSVNVMTFLVSGLTSGNSYTFTWAYSDGNNGSQLKVGDPGGVVGGAPAGTAGPLHMAVWAA